MQSPKPEWLPPAEKIAKREDNAVQVREEADGKFVVLNAGGRLVGNIAPLDDLEAAQAAADEWVLTATPAA